MLRNRVTLFLICFILSLPVPSVLHRVWDGQRVCFEASVSDPIKNQRIRPKGLIFGSYLLQTLATTIFRRSNCMVFACHSLSINIRFNSFRLFWLFGLDCSLIRIIVRCLVLENRVLIELE